MTYRTTTTNTIRAPSHRTRDAQILAAPSDRRVGSRRPAPTACAEWAAGAPAGRGAGHRREDLEAGWGDRWCGCGTTSGDGDGDGGLRLVVAVGLVGGGDEWGVGRGKGAFAGW